MSLPPFHAHPEVLALVAVIEGAYLWALARLGPDSVPAGEPAATRRQVASFTLGVAAILVASEWPIHDLAEHYLFSVHMVQHLLISLVAPPLLLLGIPAWLMRKVVSPRPIRWAIRHLARPLIAMVLFNLVIVFTHWPVVVDLMLRHHPLHFVGHVVLFGSATLMWWPVISPLPEMPGLSYPGRMLYLFLQSLVPTVPASFLTFGTTPLYPFYASAPRIWGISVLTDQTMSGLIMKLVGGAILWTGIAVIFFKWFRQEQTDGWDALAMHRVDREISASLSRADLSRTGNSKP
jgi:putative membrane protein